MAKFKVGDEVQFNYSKAVLRVVTVLPPDPAGFEYVFEYPDGRYMLGLEGDKELVPKVFRFRHRYRTNSGTVVLVTEKRNNWAIGWATLHDGSVVGWSATDSAIGLYEPLD